MTFIRSLRGISATLVVLGVLTAAAPARAIVITGGPTYSPGGGWSCTTPTSGTEKLAGGATYTCTGTAGAFSNLYIGIKNNNVPAGTTPIGDKMNSNGATQPTGSEIYAWSSDGAANIVYTGSTTITGFGTAFTRMTLSFTGTGSVVDDATTQALSNANGAVHSLWRIGSAVSSMTVNALLEASASSGGPFSPADVFFGTPTTHRQGQGAVDVDLSHVDVGFYTSTCGDGTLDTNNGAEQCDSGSGVNGTAGSCCSATCQFKPNNTACTDDGNVCTTDLCNGASATCQHAAGNGGTVCRSSTGTCDGAETCTGASTTCPADTNFASSTVVCRASSGAPCDVAENCTGSSNTCPNDGFASATLVCRSSSGACDPAENCTGTGPACPGDSLASSTTVCRSQTGDCDVAETCDGTSADCPADAFLSSTTVCRASAGDCDVAESCPGTSGACPTDDFLSSTTVCRASAGDCDVAESCSGTSADCPSDGFEPATTVCRGSAGVCDTAESCSGTDAACPPDAKSTAVCRSATGDCDVADSCDGVDDDCPPDVVVSSGTTCRSSAGACDVAETCDGVSTACPADSVQPSGTVCRSTAGACDIAETCDGASTACPADSFEPGTTVCRSSAGDCDQTESCPGTGPACPPDSVQGAFVTCRPSAGPCDVAENCTGSSTTCPPDGFQPATFTCRSAAGACDVAETCTGTGAACPTDQKSSAVCRSSAGACDVAESCDGSSNNCPADSFQTVGTTCRSATGTCDVAEVCTGVSAACPPDLSAPDNTPCNDSNTCTNPDTCQSGVCTGPFDPTQCSDHYLCYKIKTPKFTTSPTVTLVDDFDGTVSASSLRGRQLCTPASKNGSPVTDSTTHLAAYSFRQSVPHTRRTLSSTDQFGTLSLTTIKPDTLLVPSNKDLNTTPPAPDNNSINVDHYKCYKAKVTPGTPKFPKGVQVAVSDQFNSPPKLFDVRKPKHFCNVVNKNSEGVHNANARLVCYQVKGSKGQPRHVRRTVFVNNQFAPAPMSTVKESELCLPAVLN